MLQLSFIRENKELVIKRLAIKNFEATALVEEVITLDEQRRSTQKILDDTLAKANKLAKEIGQLFKTGKRELAEQARQAGMDCVVTSVLESAAGIWAASQLAAAIDPWFPGLAHGLATSPWLDQNTGEPPVIIDGKIVLPTTAGSGFQPYEHKAST